MKKAFTLIELLVVIAIIAILAAILFPVFAQAKAAAKMTANLSNVKNLGLAVIIYTNDSDDSFPLAQRYEPANNAFFGLEPWQVSTQPYVKSWGIFEHPLGPAISNADPALAAWKRSLHYGVMAKAANVGFSNYLASTALGSFSRRVLGGQTVKYDGLFGNGIGTGAGETPWYGGSVSVNSATTTSVGNPSEAFLLSEGVMWDLWSNVGQENPCTFGVQWIPGVYNITGAAQSSMACPSARKNPKPQADIAGNPPGACTPSNSCDGINFGIQNGLTTYVATDGHALARDYRGQLMATAKLGDGTVVIKSMWPGGF